MAFPPSLFGMGARFLWRSIWSLALVGCSKTHLTFLAPQGAIAARQRNHFLQIVALVAIVIIPVLVAVSWMAWRYRYGTSRAPYRPNWEFSWPLEMAI